LIAPRHLHHHDEEAWYVLEGTLRVQSGENEIEARAGSAVLVPRGTPHTYWNAGPGRLRYLLIMTANIFSLIQGIHALKERTPATLQELFRMHDSELL
jgi:quercetin dioxygenase-like cupin family protein